MNKKQQNHYIEKNILFEDHHLNIATEAFDCSKASLLEALFVVVFAKFKYANPIHWLKVNDNTASYQVTKVEPSGHIPDIIQQIRLPSNKNTNYTITPSFLLSITYQNNKKRELFEDFQNEHDVFSCVLAIEDKKIRIKCQYTIASWDAWLLDEMFASYDFLINDIHNRIHCQISSISVVAPQQKAWLADWNATSAPLSKSLTLHNRIQAMADQQPDAIAIISEHQCLTYRELNQQSICVAKNLLSLKLDLKKPIAVLAKKDAETIIVLLGILKAGGFYLPLKYSDPFDRNNSILQESCSSIVIVDNENFKQSFAIPVVKIKSLFNECLYADIVLERNNQLNSLAYVIYTSGSTGKPKGVAITHVAALNTLEDMAQRLSLDRKDRILCISALGFDLSVFDIFGSLISCAAVVIPEECHEKNPQAWMEKILAFNVTVWNSVPALMVLLLEYIKYHPAEYSLGNLPLRWVLLSGDMVSPNLPDEIRKYINANCQVFALGGSTEAAIWSIGSEITLLNSSNPIPYGYPLLNQNIHILDDSGEVLPPGAIGEIAISGKGLAQEYWLNEELTLSRFPDIKEVGRVFLTRDYGYINSKTALAEFLGRLDKQVKLNGNRIDLTEIEKYLYKIDGIKTAMVIIDNNESTGKKLTAILQPNDTEKLLTIKQLRFELGKNLPESLLPSHYVWINQWPLTENGKIDSHALKSIIKQNQKSVLSPSQQILTSPQIKIFPMPRNQEGMLYEIMNGNSSTYSFAVTFDYATHLDSDRIRAAFKRMMVEIEALRAIFKSSGTIEINNSLAAPYYYFNWSNATISEASTGLNSRHQQILLEGFKINQAPLFSIEHFCLPNNKDKIRIYCNHILFDAASTTVLAEKLQELYESTSNGYHQKQNFCEYLLWRDKLDISKHISFWQNELAIIEETSLLSNKPQQEIIGSQPVLPNTIRLSLNTDDKRKVETFCLNQSISLVALLQGCWSLLLSFWLDKSIVISGLAYSGRHQIPKKWQELVGCFINTLPLIICVDSNETFTVFIKKVHDKIQELKMHDIVSLSELNQASNLNIAEYFDSVFTAFNFKRPRHSPGMKLEKIAYSQVTHFPVTIQFDPEVMELTFEFLPNVFDSIQQLSIVDSYYGLIKQALIENVIIKDFEIVQSKDNSKSLSLICGEKIDSNFDVYEEFGQRVQNSPNKIACVTDQTEYTYKQLWTDVNSLRKSLKENLMGSDKQLAILLPRGYCFIVSVLACLQSRIAFIPLNTDWPESLLIDRLKKANCSNAIGMSIKSFKDFTCDVHLYDNLVNAGRSNSIDQPNDIFTDAAYILFTSGSSGEPKGVKISIDALNNNVMALERIIKCDEKDVWLSITPTTFDIVLLEILLPLSTGGTLLFPTELELDSPNALNDLVSMYTPTHIQTTPSRWELLLKQPLLISSCKCLLTGGEALTESLFHKLSDTNKRVINLYGPTEATIWTTSAELTSPDSIHIGKPIANTWCAVINKFNQILPRGMPGELCIGGKGLSIGYMNLDQTAESFISLAGSYPFERVYKTGDRVHMDQAGNLHFLGRIDRQLKLRGQRIDPIEIEKTLIESGQIKNAVVTSSSIDPHKLIACIQPNIENVQPMRFSVFCFPEESSCKKNIFDFYKTLAKEAEKQNLYGIWVPERHFDPVGASFSAPAVVAGALSSITNKLIISAGSVVLPLHHPVTVMEQWATLDCLSNGRARFSVASGWHPDDFVLAPENYANRKEVLLEKLKFLKNSWDRGFFQAKNGAGDLRTLALYPQPIQKNCPMWVTVAEDIDVFIMAGKLGLNLLTHLLFQDIDELTHKLIIYRKTLKENGFDPRESHVAVMIHTYVHPEKGIAEANAEAPLIKYLKSHLRLMEKITHSKNIKTTDLSDDYFQEAAKRFVKTKSLIGTPEECEEIIIKLQQAGVDEIACLVDFGLPDYQVLNGLKSISKLQSKVPDLHYKNNVDAVMLKKILNEKLPSAMIPSEYLIVDELPLTQHGKIDVNKIKFLEKNTIEDERENSPEISTHHDQTIDKIVSLWCAVLHRNTINMCLSFFDQGGHSLRAIELLGMVEDAFNVKISISAFLKSPYIDDLVACINLESSDQLVCKQNDILTVGNSAISSLLSPMQKGVWIFNQLFPNAVCYHDAFLFSVDESISIDSLCSVLRQSVLDEIIFNSAFLKQGDDIIQKIAIQAPSIEIKNHAEILCDDIRENFEFINSLRTSMKKSFDFNSGSLVRMVIHRFPDRAYLEIVMHHIITDGISLFNFLRLVKKKLLNQLIKVDNHKNYFDFVSDYASFCNNIDIKLVHNYIKSRELTNLQNTIRGKETVILRSFKGFQKSIHFNEIDLAKVKEKARKKNTSVKNIILAAYTKSLLSIVNEDAVQVGVPISLRDAKWKKCLGLFINFGVFSVKNNDAKLWDASHWIDEITQIHLFLLENRKIPFASLISELETRISSRFNPLFQFVFNAFDIEQSSDDIFHHIPVDYSISRFDLEFQAYFSEKKWDLNFIFSHDVFSKEDSEKFMNNFIKQLAWILDDNQTFLDNSSQGVISYWRSVYDNMYKKISDLSHQKWLGWQNSKNGMVFPKDEMQVWLDDIINKIKRKPLGHILEIGCGTGAILAALKREYKSYVGIDISPTIVEKLNMAFKCENTRFLVMQADNIDSLYPRHFDTIILNSVTQYFPNLDYLRYVIRKSVKLLNPNHGRIIIGDIRNEFLKNDFYAYSEQEFKKAQLSEKELFLSPEFCYRLREEFPALDIILPEIKYSRFDNELTKFRFDLSLEFSADEDKVIENNITIMNGESVDSLQDLKSLILKNEYDSSSLLITGLSNARVGAKGFGVDPADLHALFSKLELNFIVLLHPTRPDKLLCYVSLLSQDLPTLSQLESFITDTFTQDTSKLINMIESEALLESHDLVNDVNVVLKQIWERLLNLNDIDSVANFFELGGDSLLFVRLFNEIVSHGYVIKMSDLLSRHTLMEQIELLVDKAVNYRRVAGNT